MSWARSGPDNYKAHLYIKHENLDAIISIPTSGFSKKYIADDKCDFDYHVCLLPLSLDFKFEVDMEITLVTKFSGYPHPRTTDISMTIGKIIIDEYCIALFLRSDSFRCETTVP